MEEDLHSKLHAEKPSIFETMKDAYKEEDKASNRRSETKNETSLFKSVHQHQRIK